MSAPESLPIRLLVVEDNPADVRLLREMLRGPQRMTLTIATTLADALGSALENAPDLTLLDLSLPDSGGLETFRVFSKALPRVPTMILTGLSDERTARAAVASGAQDFLVKDHIDAEILQRAIRHSIERHHYLEEHRRLERELSHSRKLEAVGQLAAGIAHEINTPTQYVNDNLLFLKGVLGDVMGAVGRLRASLGSATGLPDEVRHAIEKLDLEFLEQEIPRSIDESMEGLGRVTRIVRAMTFFSQPAGEVKVLTNVNKVLDSTVVVASNEWKHVAEVERDFDPKLPLVPCLPGEVNQVFLGLLINAAQAVEEARQGGRAERGRILISTRQRRGCVEIRFADTGCGIPEENRRRVFDPFFTTKAVGKGTGQGLSTAHDVIARRHGGSIEVESSDARGTTFVVRLPLRPSEDVEPAG